MIQDDTTTIEQKTNPIVAVWRHPLVGAFLSDPITLVSAAFLAVILLAALLAPWVAPYNPQEQQLKLRHTAPLSTGTAVLRQQKDADGNFLEEQRFFLLGTDHLGRDYLSRLIFGGRISISVGLLGVLVSGAIGVFLGLMAGYYRGLIDDVIMRAVDVFMSVPLLLLALMVLFILGPSFTNIIIVFAVARWMLFCRVTRGVVMSLREQAFVDAARAIGCSDGRIIARHIIPNLLTPLLTLAALEVPRNILTESTLSFLGFGIQPPESSWGLMLAQGRTYIVTAWWVVVVPGMAIFLSALSFNLFGVWMRAVSDPLQRWRWLKATKESKAAGIKM